MEQKGRLVVPALDAPDEDILDFFKRYFNDDASYRCRQLERMCRNIYYFIGRQWIQLDTEAIPDGVRGYKLRDIPQPEGFYLPRPVINRIAPTVEVEMATLGKRELTPNVIPTSNDPRIIAAAKVAKEILQYRMEVNNWPEVREMATFLTIVCGTGIVKSYWDETYSDTTLVGSPDAVKCPACPTLLSSRTVEKEKLPGLKHTETAYGETADTMQLSHCPTCEQTIPLIPTELDEEQAAGDDFLGRPLGVDVPKGNTAVEVVSPFDIFPENGGVDTGPKNFKHIGQASVRSLDWIEERYPHIVDELAPDDPEEMSQLHPTLGEWTYAGRYDSSLDSGIYENHARVFEFYQDKCYRYPEGRRIVVVGDKSRLVAENDVLYHTNAEGVKAPRVKYAVSNFKPGRYKEFWGQALVDDLISPQNRINGIDAQIIEARERLGSPNILATEGMDLSGPSWFTNYGLGKIMYWTPDPMSPTLKPEPFGGTTMPSPVYEERDRVLSDMKDIAGPQDVEVGEAPKNVSTTSGLQLLGEQAERRRSARDRSLSSMYQEVWEHQLKLVWCLREEMDEYEKQMPDNTWEVIQYNRMAVAGQTKVKVEKQAFVDKSIYQKEAAREALADGLIIVDGQSARKKLLEMMNLPTDINEDLNRQVENAKKQWTEFVDNGILPVIDTGLDDYRIRYQTLGTFLLTDEGKRLEESIRWPEILKKIAGWEEELGRAEVADAAAVAFYGTRDPIQAQPMYEQAQQQFVQEQQLFAEQMDSASQIAETSGVAPPPMPPPMPPPPPIFLPPAKDDRIYLIWRQQIDRLDNQQAQATGEPPVALAPEQDAFLKFRAVVDAYRLMAEAKEMGMRGGMISPVGPPGSPEGTPGAPANPGVQPINFPGAPNPPNPPNVPGGRDRNLMQGFRQ